MLICSKVGFVIPIRKYLPIVVARRRQFFTATLSPLTHSLYSYKPNPCACLIENRFLDHRILYSVSYHTKRPNGVPFNRSIRYCTNEANEKKEPEKKLSLFQRFKEMSKSYWYVLIPVHLITSAFWFGSFYYLVKSGVDVAALLEMVGASKTLIEKLKSTNSTMGYLAIASAIYKIATPARYTVTLGGTTLSIKYLKEWGLIKPIPPREKLKEIIDEKKENIKEFYENKIKKKEG